MKNKFITISLILCILVGCILLFIRPIQALWIRNLSQQLEVDSLTYEEVTHNIKAEVSYDFEQVHTLTIWDVLSTQASVKDIPVIGSMHIPSVELTLPIVKGVGTSALAVGAGTMKPDQVMGEGNYALASHYIEGKDVLFGPLYKLKENDRIFLSDLQYMYEYVATDIKVIEATDVYIIDDVPNTKLLTLITCAEEGTKRLAVQAEMVKKTKIE